MMRRWLSGTLAALLAVSIALIAPSPTGAITTYSKISSDQNVSGKITGYKVCTSLLNCRGAVGRRMQLGYAVVHYYGPYGCTDGCKRVPLAPFGTQINLPTGLILEDGNGGYVFANPVIVYDTGDANTEAATIALGRGFVDIWCGVEGTTYAANNCNLVNHVYDFSSNYTSWFDVP